jgi:hypothetical protein
MEGIHRLSEELPKGTGNTFFLTLLKKFQLVVEKKNQNKSTYFSDSDVEKNYKLKAMI